MPKILELVLKAYVNWRLAALRAQLHHSGFSFERKGWVQLNQKGFAITLIQNIKCWERSANH